MKRHQVLTGSVNPGSHCYSVGLISDFTFWAYGSGCDLVISSSSQQPIQIISGHGNVLITSVDCAHANGRIAVAYGKDIVIYNPVRQENHAVCSYNWVKDSSFSLSANEGTASILSWNFDGDQLLVGCTVISLWSSIHNIHVPSTVSFHLEDIIENPEQQAKQTTTWKHLWSSGFSEKPIQLAFSQSRSESLLFASVSQGECMIKVWYLYRQMTSHKRNPFFINKRSAAIADSSTNTCTFNSKASNFYPIEYEIDFTFTYLLHPQPVVSFEWRKNFILNGSEKFANVLISSSLDQICRVWVETKQPLSKTMRFHNAHHDEHSRKRKQNTEDVDRFKKAQSSPIIMSNLDTSFSNPLLDKKNVTDIYHFHIAATINPLSDIPLLPSISVTNRNAISTCDDSSVFTVHWLNNKFYQIQLLLNKLSMTDQATEIIDHSFAVQGSEDETDDVKEHTTLSSANPVEDFKISSSMIEKLTTAWRDSRDALFSIHPADGSLLVWHIDWLDENRSGLIRQPQVCFSSRIPKVFSSGDAATLGPRVVLFVNHSTEQNFLHSASYISFKSTTSCAENQTKAIVYSDVQLLSKHNDGSLNLWQLTFSDTSSFSSVTSMCHSSRFCGHCFHLTGISPHPILPLLLTTAVHTLDDGKSDNEDDTLSELILWRVDPVGPLSYSGGLSELARVSCQKHHSFAEVAWFPVLFPSWCLGTDNSSPSTGFISLGNNSIQIYQSVVDAANILADVMSPVSDDVSFTNCSLISQQSSVHPGCVLHLHTFQDNGRSWGKTLFLGTFTDKAMSPKSNLTTKSVFAKFSQSYYAVLLEQSSTALNLHTWKITFSANIATARARNRRATIRITDSSDDESEEEIMIEVPTSLSNVKVDIAKLSTQQLFIPSLGEVSSVCSEGGIFDMFFTSEKESLYPAPYHLCTACNDGNVYFWLCNIQRDDTSEVESCKWQLWKPADCSNNSLANMNSNSIFVQRSPLLVKAANSNLLACMWCKETLIKPGVNLFVTIYECASTGGSHWREQDTITYTFDESKQEMTAKNLTKKIDVTDFHLDWLSREEGSFFLLVGYATNVQIFSLAPKDMKTKHQIDSRTKTDKDFGKKPFVKQSTLDVHTRQKIFTSSKVKHIEESSDFLQPTPKFEFDSQIHWRLLRWTKLAELNIDITGSTLLQSSNHMNHPHPIKVSWARDGILIVAAETEMHVFCQWLTKDSIDYSMNLSKSQPISTVDDSLCLTKGLSEFADEVCPSLQQYHPLVLSELMNSNHLNAVREILIHLAICMNGDFRDNTCEQEDFHVEKYQFSDQLAHILQLSSSSNRITLLPLQNLLGRNGKIVSDFTTPNAGKPKSKAGEVENKHEKIDSLDDILAEDDFNSTDEHDDELDEILGITRDKKKIHHKREHVDLSKLEPHYFGKEHCKVIHEFLVRNQLPGLTSLDQMELMALADTLELATTSNLQSNTTDDVSYHDQSNTMGLSAGERGYAVSGGGASALDNCGLRFIMAMHNHLCLLNSLPATNRKMLLKQGLSTCQFAWAFHSETEEEMLSLLPSVQRNSPEWPELRSLGVCWWIRSNVLLRRLVEQMARVAFLKNNDPLDASLFYLALNKKSVLCGLFKSVKDLRMNQFFQHDFTEERWRRAALDNAYVLMGKQRFFHAAAFFLLAGSVRYAVDVCMEKLKDMQLALLIVRLRENSDVSYHQLLLDHVLCEANGIDGKRANQLVHSDSFVRSMAYWILGKYKKSVNTLLDDIQYEDISDIFNFYVFLRCHPIILRNKVQNGDLRSVEQVDQDGVWQNASDQERCLIFQTAVVHLESGCPMLALDCLSKLPKFIEESPKEEVIIKQTDVIEDPGTSHVITVADKDPLSSEQVDWSQPVALGNDDELDLNWSDEEVEEDSDDASRPSVMIELKTVSAPVKQEPPLAEAKDLLSPTVDKVPLKQDTFAQHLRITACFKIFIQELKAIANAYSTDGGQLRSKLYMWLENASCVMHGIFGMSKFQGNSDTSISKKKTFTCDSSSDTEDSASVGSFGTRFGSSQAPSLHELILADNQDWKTRRKALARRKQWLQCHHSFLRTLLSYCNLHDSAYGLLATMRMELLLLLQESLQDKNMTNFSLTSPVPSLSDSIPLITSSIASCKTVVADPLTYLCHITRDVLRATLCFTKPPLSTDYSMFPDRTMLCSQAAALSTCIYQSLCDTSTPTFHTQLLRADNVSMDGILNPSNSTLSSSLNAPPSSVLQQSSCTGTSDEPIYCAPTTAPSQWPGVAQLQAMLNAETAGSENRTKIMILLCEAAVAVFVSLLIHGLQTNNTSLLYRLCNHNLGSKMWNAVFGGGVKIPIKYSKSRSDLAQMAPNDARKFREKLNRKVLLPSERKGSITVSTSSGNEALSYREKYVPPELSLWDWFLMKPFHIQLSENEAGFDSDTEESDASSISSMSQHEDMDDIGFDFEEKPIAKEQTNSDSYSWKLMRCAVVMVANSSMQSFIRLAGFDLNELNSTSTLLSAVLRTLQEWESSLSSDLDESDGPPADFLPSMNSVSTGLEQGLPARPAMLKYQSMLEPNNTPFQNNSGQSKSCQRLWHSLVKKESLQKTFIKYLFEKNSQEKKTNVPVHEDDKLDEEDGQLNSSSKSYFEGPIKILHKESELLAAFCINNVNSNCIALASAKDIQEIDLSDLLASDMWTWVDESGSNMDQKSSSGKEDDFLFVSVPKESKTAPVFTPGSSVPWSSTTISGQGANILMKRPASGIRRMESHPSLPYYVTGHRDGGIFMWEWGHHQQISQFQPSGQFAKVSNVHFSTLGNKLCSVDGDGFMTLWQVSSSQKPFFKHLCHDRGASDFCFVSSSSVIATVGLSSTHRNVAVWDTLMPRRSILVKDFAVHDQAGTSCIKYLSRYNTLVVGGKNGVLSFFDDRCIHNPLHRFIAHDASIKCLAIDPNERFYVTGSATGDVKVWDSLSHKLLYASSNEHVRSSLFRNFGSGTVQIMVTSKHLLTCGADGSLKMKLLLNDEQFY